MDTMQLQNICPCPANQIVTEALLIRQSVHEKEFALPANNLELPCLQFTVNQAKLSTRGRGWLKGYDSQLAKLQRSSMCNIAIDLTDAWWQPVASRGFAVVKSSFSSR